MNPERAWKFNGVVDKVFADVHTKNANDVDMAVSALSVGNNLDDENFVDSFVQDFEQAGKVLGHPLNENDVADVENAVKTFAESHISLDNVKETSLDVVTFNGDYLNTVTGEYAADGTVPVYTGKSIDDNYQQSVNNIVSEPVDVKNDASIAQSNAVKFNNTVNALVEPRNKEYDEGIMALGFQSAYNKVDVSDEHFAKKIGENFIQASQCLELEDEVNQAGGQDVVVSQAQSFHDAHVNEDKEYSLVDVADENAKQLRASKDVNIDEDNIIDSNKFESKVKTVWADSNKQFYDEDENDYQPAVDKSSNTMAGKNVDLLVNSLVPIRYNTKDGNQKLGALVYASKRGDVPDQKTKFDGSMVVNQYTKYGKLSHAQLVSLDSAKAIMSANGYGDMDDSAFDYAADKKYDYGKELLDRGHAMTFTANVFSPEGAKYGDFKFNPNPEKIGKSDVPFDVETHVEAVQAREEEHAKNLAKYKEKQASQKDEGLEP